MPLAKLGQRLKVFPWSETNLSRGQPGSLWTSALDPQVRMSTTTGNQVLLGIPTGCFVGQVRTGRFTI